MPKRRNRPNLTSYPHNVKQRPVEVRLTFDPNGNLDIYKDVKPKVEKVEEKAKEKMKVVPVG